MLQWRLAVLGVLVAAGSLVGAGCGSPVGSLSFKSPAGTAAPVSAPPETWPPGLSAKAEPGVPGAPTTTVPVVGPGPAAITGTVLGPSGAVGGAVVEIDRFVGDAYASARTTTAADGSWSFPHILGGDYRVRAWQAPTLDMAAPQYLFVADDQAQTMSLQLTSYQGQQVQAAINPATPVQNQPANLVLRVTNPNVNANGVLSSPPVPGASVMLVNGPGWQLFNGNPLTTDAAGDATFQVECTFAGADPLQAQVSGGAPVALQLPPCGAPLTVTTTTTVPFQPTTTSCPSPSTLPGEPATTTTSLAFGSC